MLLCDAARFLVNGVRLHTVYAGIGRRSSGMRLGKSVRLWNRGHICLGSDVHIGDFCRVLAGARSDSIRIGDRTFIHDFCILRTAGGFIHLGCECSLNPFCVVYGDGGVTLGDCVRIAAHTTIVAAEHKFDRLDIPITQQGTVGHGIVIEDDVWIGANCVITDGVRISSGSVVGGGAVVTRDVKPNTIVVGVPARPLRQRAPTEIAGKP